METVMTGIGLCGQWLKGKPGGHAVAQLLSLAAAPTFAAMALITAAGPADMLCGTAQGLFSLQGMVPMYALMSAFHLAPWLRLIR